MPQLTSMGSILFTYDVGKTKTFNVLLQCKLDMYYECC